MQLFKKTVYIREEDLEAWKACPNKSLMVHNALQPYWVGVDSIKSTGLDVGSPVVSYDKAPGVKVGEPIRVTLKKNWCKAHNMEKEFCINFKH